MKESKFCARCGHISAEVPQYSAAALRLLRTNEPPEPVDKAIICDELKRGCDLLARLKEEIAMLLAKVAGLQTKERSVQRFVDDHRTILSPLRCIRLPAEILTDIFRYATPVADTDIDRGIWQLGRVSSYWRNVLLSSKSSSSLWSTISVLKQSSSSSNFTSRLRLSPVVGAILLRSGNTLLNLSLSVSDNPTADTWAMIERILAESTRWHKASIRGCSGFPQFSALKGHIPMLHELEYVGQQFPKWVAAAPSLQYLHINLRCTPPPLAALDVPWSQLRRCILKPLSPQREIELLQLCPNLEEHCLISGASNSNDESSKLLMPKLHTLEYHFPNNHIVLNGLSLPSLTCVTLSGYNGDNSVISTFTDLVSRSSGSLSKLELSLSSPVSKLPFQFISQTPLHSLTVLHLACEAFQNFYTIDNILTVSENSTIFLPRLERLHLIADAFDPPEYQFKPDDFGPVITMTRSRWRLSDMPFNISRLAFLEFKTINISRFRGLRGALAPLLTFCEEGLEIIVDNFYLQEEEG